MTLSTNKSQSKAVMSSAGTPVARGEVLHEGMRPTIPLPVILKPCSEDNSMGVSLVTQEEEIEQAVTNASKFDKDILCEQYIPLGKFSMKSFQYINSIFTYFLLLRIR